MPRSRPIRTEPIEVRLPLPELIEGLSRPEAFGESGAVEVVQTHASVVFLVGGQAVKVKKPVRLWGLIDYGTLAQRKRFCEEEVRLNRRLAPELYLGVARVVRRRGRLEVSESGRALEHAVRMVRLPPGASLQERLDAGEEGLGAEIDRVAETLASFHAANRLPAAEARTALPSGFGRVLVQNFRGTRAGVPELFPAAVHDGLRRALASRLAGARGVIRRRVAEGRMVEGHGDVRLEHVVRHRGRIALIDCVEFTPLLRRIDPLSDLAFLSMELRVRGHRGLAERLEQAYLARAPDPDEALLLPLYGSYRAHVRAKVDHQVTRDPDVPAAARALRAGSARRHLVLAWTLARVGRVPPLVAMHGPSGSGKSVLAGRLAPWLDAEVVRSDEVRKALAGLAPTDRPTGEQRDLLYGTEMSGRTYAALVERARAVIRSGRAVILDATFLTRSSRGDAAAAARALGAPYAILDCRCPTEVARDRLAHRAAEGSDASDADFEVHRRQAETAEPLGPDEEPFVVPFDAGEAPETPALRLAERVEARDPSGP